MDHSSPLIMRPRDKAAGRQLFCTVLRYRRTNQNKTKQKQKKNKKHWPWNFVIFVITVDVVLPGRELGVRVYAIAFLRKKLFKLTVNIPMRKIILEVEYLKNTVKPLFTDTRLILNTGSSLLRTVCFVSEERKPLHSL